MGGNQEHIDRIDEQLELLLAWRFLYKYGTVADDDDVLLDEELGNFSFIADYIDEWLSVHKLTHVLVSLQ